MKISSLPKTLFSPETTESIEVEAVASGVELRITCVPDPNGDTRSYTVTLGKDTLRDIFNAVVDAVGTEEDYGEAFKLGTDEDGKPVAVKL